jgi:carboxyl-terminal processing protease
MRSRRNWLAIILLGLLTNLVKPSCALSDGIPTNLAEPSANTNGPSSNAVKAELAKIKEIADKIKEHYAGPGLTNDPCNAKSIQELTQQLDCWSGYFPKEEWEQIQAGGKFSIGIALDEKVKGKPVRILYVYPQGPAAGLLHANDRILNIDGVDVGPLKDLEAVVARFQGKQEARIVVERPIQGQSAQQLNIVIHRGPVTRKRDVFSAMINGNSGYIYISQFNDGSDSKHGTGEEVVSAIEELRGNGIRKLIIDLRQNIGGSVKQTLGLTAHFMSKGVPIVRFHSKDGSNQISTTVDGPFKDKEEMSLTLLVDGETMSAAELLAATLQFYGRATIVGSSRTRGKAEAMSEFTLSDGSGLLLTTGHWQKPDAAPFDINAKAVGVTPDVLVRIENHETEVRIQQSLLERLDAGGTLDPNADPVLNAALEPLR